MRGNDLRVGSFAGRIHLGASSHSFLHNALVSSTQLHPSARRLEQPPMDAEIEL